MLWLWRCLCLHLFVQCSRILFDLHNNLNINLVVHELALVSPMQDLALWELRPKCPPSWSVEPHIGLQSFALLCTADQGFSVSLQDTPLGFCCVSQILLYFATPGQTHVYQISRWVMCAIWINGSKLLDPACLMIELDISSRWKSAMPVKTMARNIRMTVHSTVWFIWFNLGI